MKALRPAEELNRRLTRACILLVLFLALTVGTFFALSGWTEGRVGGTFASRATFQLGGAVLLALLTVRWMVSTRQWSPPRRAWWYCPLVAAGVSVCLLGLSYAYLGVWPLGEKSVMLVDMHHQYAPLFSELRDILLHGGSVVYSTHIGLGANLAPAIAYYLASPLNLLLVLFPQRYLTEVILLITLLKNAGAAAAFAACAQERYRRRDAGVVAVAVLYANMAYLLAYSWNIMWLDAVALLPVVVLCLERMLAGKSRRGYVLSLALTLFTSYYIGFMVCVFLVLYMVVWAWRQARGWREIGRAAGRFATASLLGGGLVAFLLVPTVIALGRTSAAGGTLGAFSVNFPLFDLFGRLFYGASPTIRSGNLPNLYCGAAAVLLLPVYLTARAIPLRRRLCYGGLLAVLLVSCTIEPLNLLWHGLHAPNDLPYRFSFLIGFVLLLMAGRTLYALPHCRPGAILGSLGGCAAYLVLWEKLGGDAAPPDWLIYANLLLLAVYAGILLLPVVCRRLPAHAGRNLLLLVVAAELLLGGGETLAAMDKAEHYTAHAAYVDNAATVATDAALRRAEELAVAAGETGCRIEFLPRTTCMDTALHHYRGLTAFASSNPYRTTVLMGRLGYGVNGVNSYQYHTFLSAADSLLGLEYVVLDFPLSGHSQLQLVESLAVEEEYRYIYRNPLALPVGYCVNNAVRQFQSTEYAPFTAQEQLYSAMTGQPVTLYTVLPLDTDSVAATCSESAFTKYATEESAVLLAAVDSPGRYYGYMDCRAADALTVETCDAAGLTQTTWSVTPYEPYIIDLGQLEPGQSVRAVVRGEGTFSGHVYVVRLDDNAVQTHLTALKTGGYQVTAWRETRLTGTIDAGENQVLLLSLPYDRGWHAVVDGQPVETFPVDADASGKDGALLGVTLSAGQHTVELRYRTPGAAAGWSITAVSAGVALLLLWLSRRRRKTAQDG